MMAEYMIVKREKCSGQHYPEGDTSVGCSTVGCDGWNDAYIPLLDVLRLVVWDLPMVGGIGETYRFSKGRLSFDEVVK